MFNGSRYLMCIPASRCWFSVYFTSLHIIIVALLCLLKNTFLSWFVSNCTFHCIITWLLKYIHIYIIYISCSDPSVSLYPDQWSTCRYTLCTSHSFYIITWLLKCLHIYIIYISCSDPSVSGYPDSRSTCIYTVYTS